MDTFLESVVQKEVIHIFIWRKKCKNLAKIPEPDIRCIPNWQPTHFGTQTKIIFLHYNNNSNGHHVIIKNVHTTILEANITIDIKNSYSSVTEVKRFIKNGQVLPVVKVSFSSIGDAEKIINECIFIDDLFLRPEKYIPTKQPTRCFNCQKYGSILQEYINLCKMFWYTQNIKLYWNCC